MSNEVAASLTMDSTSADSSTVSTAASSDENSTGNSLPSTAIPVTETQYKQAMKKLARLDKQNSFLIDELVKSRQCINQLKLEKSIILDRVSDVLVGLDDEDEDEDEDDDEVEDEGGLRVGTERSKPRELLDELVEGASTEEAFARALFEISSYQPAEFGKKSRTPSITSSSTNPSSATPSASVGNKKRSSRSVTSGARFARPSPLTQGTDDEQAATAGAPGIPGVHPRYAEDEDLDIEDAELAQLKRSTKRSHSPDFSTAGNNSAPETPNNSEAQQQVLKVIPVPFDADGNPILPLSLNMITIHSLGEVVHDRPAYHNKRYLLPVGFISSRSYSSCLEAEAMMNYFSAILDNGSAPLYQVSSESHPEIVFQSTSTTGAWAAVAKAVAAIRGKDNSASVSGPDYFGLSNPTVSMLIERLPGAEKCEAYQPKRYEVSNLVGGKSVKKALMEESLAPTNPADSNMDIEMN